MFVGSIPANADPGPDAVRHEVVTFAHCHLAARDSLLDVSRKLEDPSTASSSELLARTHFLRTTDIHNRGDIVWVNVNGFQAKDASQQEAQWSFIRAVLTRWQAQTDHFVLGGDFNASLSIRQGYSPTSVAHAADSLIFLFTNQLSLK